MVSEEANVDFPGNDYTSVTLDVPDVRACQEKCGVDTKCKAYTYVKPGIQGPKAICYFKNKVSFAKKSNCCTSGIKGSRASDLGDASVEPHTDRPGLDYEVFDLDQPNPILCKEKCQKDTKCKAYTYVNIGGAQGAKPRCWLKNSVPNEKEASCCVSGVKVPDSGQSTPLTEGKVVSQQKNCQQGLAADAFNKICDMIPNTECKITNRNCSSYRRQLYVGSTFMSSTKSEAENWDQIGGRGKLLSEATMCSLRELSPDATIGELSSQSKGGPIENEGSVPIGIGNLSYKQQIGFLNFDQSKLSFNGYQWLSFCAPVVGCYDAVAQDIKVELDQYSVSPQLRAGNGGPRLDKFYALNVTTEASKKQLYLKPPAFTIPTPIGPVSVQPKFDYTSQDSVVASPFNNGNDYTWRDRLDEPSWGRPSLHKDIYGVDYGIAFPILTYQPLSTTGWDSLLALGNRNPSSDAKVWSPDAKRGVRPDRDLTKSRSDEENEPSVEMTAKARATYPDAGSMQLSLPGWLTSLGGAVSLSIFVEPQARAAFSSEFSFISAEAAVPPPDIGAGGVLTESDLSIRTAAAAVFDLSVLTGLDLKVKLPLLGTIVDTHPRWPFNVFNKPGHINGEHVYFASSDGPWISKEPREYLAFKTFRTGLKRGAEAKTAYKYIEACLAPDKQLKQQPPPKPKATPGDPRELFEAAEWPCNICVYVDDQSSGLLSEANRPPTAKQWSCDLKAKNGCYDTCTLDQATGKLTFKRSPDSSLKFTEDGSTGEKCYLSPPIVK
jgi:hypothetical protein